MANGNANLVSVGEEKYLLDPPMFTPPVPDYKRATPLSIEDEYKSFSVDSAISRFNKIKNLFRNKVSNISGVNQIVGFQHKSILHLWTVLHEDDVNTYKKVYRTQREIRRQFPDVQFDFFVFTEKEQKEAGIIPPNFETLFFISKKV